MGMGVGCDPPALLAAFEQQGDRAQLRRDDAKPLYLEEVRRQCHL